VTLLLRWFDEAPDDRALWFGDQQGDDWTRYTYAELAALVRRGAGQLRAAGVRRGDAVVVAGAASPAFVGHLFGALVIGATPSPVAPPSAFQDPDAYVDHVARIAGLVRAKVLAVTTGPSDVTLAAAAKVGCEVLDGVPLDAPYHDGPAEPPAIALVQFSSGSTGRPRGVRVPLAALETNLAGIADWVSYTPRDKWASWLPMHHDMGLIGGLLLPMSRVTDAWFMLPEQFVRSPLRWLRCFRPGWATKATTPTFGLAHVLRRVRPRELDGLDFSGWRTLIVGAERVEEKVLADFADLLAPHGFDRGALLPAYGLAEATLAVSGRRHGQPMRALHLDARSLAPGRTVRLATPDAPTSAVVACGTPLRQVTVRIVDEAGTPVEDGVLGEIEVSGPSLADGYLTEEGAKPFGGVLRTGDAGFRQDGYVFVIGRLGDSVKQFGRWLFAEDVERAAAAVSPRPRQTLALLGALDGTSTAVVVVEGALGDCAADIGRAVARHLVDGRVVVATVPAGWIRRTTSGKPMRRAMWRKVADGDHGTVCWDSAAPPEGSPQPAQRQGVSG
jgi:acyl-CoA synthetase (AMP-forming)/AMP-acid ligase II